MSVVFTVIVYLAAGLAVVVWLAGQKRLPTGVVVRAAALIFWPAYLPVCLAREEGERRTSEEVGGLLGQIDRLPIAETRKQEYRSAIDRLDGAILARKQELSRLTEAERRLGELGGSFGSGGKPLVDAELLRVRTSRAGVERDLQRAKEGVLRLVLRLEVIDLHGAKSDLDGELSTLEEEIDRLLDARAQTEVLLATSPSATPRTDVDNVRR
jgi:hypothetical protein